MHILSMLDHKSRLKCIYGPESPITPAPPARAAAEVGPALACHPCCRPDAGPTLDRPASLFGRWRVAGRGLCVNCSLHSNMKNISISVKTIIIIIIIRDSPLPKHRLPCFKLSPTLSALCTQHCSGGRKKSNHILYAIPQEIITLVSHRGTDKYFLL